MALTKEALLARRPKVEKIGPVPGYDDDVHIRHITVEARNRWAALRYKALEGDSIDLGLIMESRMVLVAATLCDADGALWFGSAEEVRDLDPHAVDFIANEAERLNGLTAEAAEEIEGN